MGDHTVLEEYKRIDGSGKNKDEGKIKGKIKKILEKRYIQDEKPMCASKIEMNGSLTNTDSMWNVGRRV
jgi:hypothetical protein